MASKDTPTSETVGRGRCPICGEPTEMEYRPFCSGRCRDVDLSRWLRGGYAIPCGQADADEDGDDTSVGLVPGAPTDEDGEAAE